MAGSFALPFVAVDLLAQVSRVDCRLFPFQFPSVGEFAEDRVRLLQAVRADLERRGLADDAGPAPDVLNALELLSGYHVAIAVMGKSGGRDLYARACAAGDRGVLAVQEANGLSFRFVRPDSLARSVAELLPRVPAGPGQSVTITQPTAPPPLTEDRRGQSVFAQQVRPTRSPSEMRLQAAADILGRPRRGSGYLLVNGRDRTGNESPAPRLTWLDTDAGRYLVRTGADGHEPATSSFFPADPARLTHQLGELIVSVAPPREQQTRIGTSSLTPNGR